jgi:tRNA(Leu) C34 or U34 (ribose-2'-O)-methylase TrmL
MDSIARFLELNGPKIGAPFGGVQIILIGDLYQLPPVVTSREREIFSTVYASPYFFSARAKKSFWEVKLPEDPVFVFGCETKGLPEPLKRRYARRLFRLPAPGSVRSFNLSTAVGMVLGEALRQHLSKE